MKQRGRRRTKRKSALQTKRMILIGSAVLAIALFVFLGYYLTLRSKVNKVPEDVICDNIYIDDVNVSGLTAKEAKAAIEKQEETYKKLTITLVAEDEKLKVTLEDLGFEINNVDKLVKKAVSYGKKGSVWKRNSDMKELESKQKVFEVSYAVDSKAVREVISNKFPKLDNAAKDATITRQDGKFIITDEKKGVMISEEESQKIIETYFNDNWVKTSGIVELVTKIEEPKVTKAQLQSVKDLLGTFKTSFVASSARGKNIQTGAKHINGAVLMPGDEYSANGAMQPYTAQNGYTNAGAYENGKVVQSMGGGICQVSSTLYNAVILAELEIVERSAHSMLVNYVEPSMDAAIAGDYKDLKFRNSTEYPIYIEAYTSGGTIIFNIYGKETRSANRKVEYITEILSQDPVAKKFVATNDAVGVMKQASSGYAGTKAKLWKVVYENGAEVSRKVQNNSTYRASAAVYNVGIASDNAEATALVKNAVATQNEAQINAAIAQAKAMIAAASAPAAPVETPTTPETTTPTTP